MRVNYKVIVTKSAKLKLPIGVFKQSFRLFNFNSIEQFDQDPSLLVLYAFFAQTNFTVNYSDPVQTIYRLLGNLPACKETADHIYSALRSIRVGNSTGHLDVIYRNETPKTAQYTFIHPDIMYSRDLSIFQKAEYIKAVKNISLRRRLEGGKLILPADYIEDWVDLTIPVITQSKDKTKIRFNLEEQIKLIKDI